MQAVGREERALAVFGEALEKWDTIPAEQRAETDGSKHEVHFDRGVLRWSYEVPERLFNEISI